MNQIGNMMNNQWVSFGFRIVISVALLLFLFSRIQVRDLIDHLQNIDFGLLALAIIFFLLYVCAWALRWHLFIADTGMKVHYFQTVRTLLIGFAVSLFLPSAIGADVGRAYDMARTHVQKVAILSTVLMDRLLGLIAVVGMAVVATLIAGFQYLTADIFFAILGIAILMVIGWLIFFNLSFIRRLRKIVELLPLSDRLGGKIRDIYVTLYYLQRKRKLFFSSVIISIITVTLEILSVILLSRAIGHETDPVFFFLFLPIIWVILIVPIAIGGLGLRETAFVFFFTQVGMDATHAVTVSLLYYSLYAVTGIISGAIPITHSLYVRGRQLLNPDNSAVSDNA